MINVFDISEKSEDDALKHSLNTESSVNKVRWQSNNCISCITHTEIVQLWSVEGAGPDVSISREEMADALQKTNPDDCYAVAVHQKTSDNLFILAGSNAGKG